MSETETPLPVNGRAEIDTSPPFGSVKEAVTHFGGSGSWIPLHKFREAYHRVDDDNDDMKNVEEQAAKLEKDLIVKELETLDVLEELATTKRIVEELKRRLQKEASKCMKGSSKPHSDELMLTPIKEVNKGNGCNLFNYNEHIVENSIPSPTLSPDLMLMELKQAKLNLGKTITDIRVIQTSFESLNRKMKNKKSFLEKTRKRLTSKFAAVSSLDGIKEIGGNPQLNIARELPPFISETRNLREKAETANDEVAGNRQDIVQTHASLKIAEMRLLAAKKMEEAARAAEAVALTEIKAISSTQTSSGFVLAEPNERTRSEEHSSPIPKYQKGQVLNRKKVICTMVPIGETNISKLAVSKKLEEATAEVRHCKRAIEEALNRIDIANRKQFEAEETLRRWTPEHDQDEDGMYDSTRLNTCHLVDHFCDTPHDDGLKNDDVKPGSKPKNSMQDVLIKKQIQPNQFAVRNHTGHPERQKIPLSQMLQELKDDLTFPIKPDKAENHSKRSSAHRKKFGFIHMSLSLTKQSKKKL